MGMGKAWLRSVWCAGLFACAPAPTSSRTAAAPAPPEASGLLDDFEQGALWQAQGSDGVSASSGQVPGRDGHALSLRFDFHGHGGYAALKRALPLDLPENYEFSFDVRGDAPRNDLQLKFADASGQNVWWYRRNEFAATQDWQRITIKKRQIEFAWGPTKNRAFERAASVEFVVYAGEGGRGTIAIDNLRMRALEPPVAPPRPLAKASSSEPQGEAALALDGKLETAWRSVPAQGKAQVFELDLGTLREFGGMLLRWQPGMEASRYDVELSRDGTNFWRALEIVGSNGGRDALRMAESEARFVRLLMHEGPSQSYALCELELEEIPFGASDNAFIAALARESPRGHYPRGFSGEQPYWTLVGADGSLESGLLSEDGALEIGAGGFSIEPFVIVDGQLTSWADVHGEHALAEGYLPVPSATWQHAAFDLEVSAFAASAQPAEQRAVAEPPPAQPRGSTELWARYVLKNKRKVPLSLKFVLAVRPYQVNPATQFLNIAGGVSPIRELSWDGVGLSVNRGPRLRPLVMPDHVGLTSFAGGGFPETQAPALGQAPQQLVDERGLASGTLLYELTLQPGQSISMGLVAPLGAVAPVAGVGPTQAATTGARQASDSAGGGRRERALAELEQRREQVLARWREQLGRVAIRVPPVAQPVVDSLRSALAHILMSRNGPVLRPGTRSYARSWIRDGAMMAEALLRLGHEDVARSYLDWFAPYQFDNGKVPCCVDKRGADPVVENDSAGEFIFLVAELFRYGADRALLERMWPHVDAASRYMEELRASQRTSANLTPERRAFYGLMPPSISHEGYSDKPAYSYWDDFWALTGYQDAAELAAALGLREDAERLARARDEFKRDLLSSLQESAARHHLDYLPGSADRGDFDATSTTIALSPGRAQAELPQPQLLATFERYYQEFEARRDGKRSWNDYTPYELRNVAAFVRLGWRDRAQQLLTFLFGDQRPHGWNQWAEVVGRELREPRFIGDMPHAWIASDYIRSALDLFAYARPSSQQLVLAAGVAPSWFEGAGVSVERLRTPYGPLSYRARRRGKTWTFEIATAGPSGGFVIPCPWQGETGRALVNGREVAWQGRELHFGVSPARVVLQQP